MPDRIRRWLTGSGETPTSEELDRANEARGRVELVVRVRWALLAIMAASGVATLLFFRTARTTGDLSLRQILAPLAIFACVAGYNYWVGRASRWLSAIRGLNKIQLLFDLLFVTAVVHFSGGALSWFWTGYLVLTLEAAFLMEKRGDGYFIAAAGSIAFGFLLLGEFLGVPKPVSMPYYVGSTLQHDYSYEVLLWAWMSISNASVAWVGSHMMETVRDRERQLNELVNRDPLTGLYNRRHFFMRLNSELQRARRYGRTFSLLVADVDHFKRYNDSYGHPAGDELLRGISGIMQSAIRRSDMKPSYEVDIGCRYGGEEFAIILPEAASVEGLAPPGRPKASVETRGALVVAERIRQQVEKSLWDGRGVTVSIGIASFPEHGGDLEGLLKAADDALYAAKADGRNRVSVAAAAGNQRTKEEHRLG
jgi:diguanylate cyclase (GGDEF)-like protein